MVRLILHAGMPKTGSSALQRALRRAHQSLLKKGVLYPVTYRGNHNFIVSGVVGDVQRIPRREKQEYAGNPQQLECDFRTYWDGVLRQVNRYRPHTIVLSGENFYRRFSESEISKLKAILKKLGDVLEVVIYLRRPSDFYLSAFQQRLKSSFEIKPFHALRYRPFIARYPDIADKLHIVPYLKQQMSGQDIVLDFAKRFLPDCVEEVKAFGGELINETVSAEAMSILFAFRQICHPLENGSHTWETTSLFDFLRKTEREDGGYTRPRLKPELAGEIERQCSDLEWLRDSFGVTFPMLYPGVPNLPDTIELNSVESICEVDPAKRERLLMLVLRALLSHKERFGYRRWVSPLRRAFELKSPELYYKLMEFFRR